MGALGAIGLAVALGGCVSTEQKATWAHVQDARIIASQSSTVVRRASHEVLVTRIALLRTGGQLAIAVSMRNTTARPVNDIPISVGVRRRRGGPRVYLNRAAGLAYFKTHVAVIPARGSVTWVFTGRAPHALADQPFAVVGSEAVPAVTVARTIPQIRATLTRAPQPPGGGTVRVTVTNLSSIPQAELQVYALAGQSGRYSAAGSGTIVNLGTGHTATARIDLIGHVRDSQVELEALPTLFQ